MFRRPTCMESCQSKGHDYDYCLISCYPPISVPTYPYLIPTAYQTPIVPYGLSQATPYSSNLYPFHTYGGGINDGWECYRRCRRNGGSAASCCYYCGIC